MGPLTVAFVCYEAFLNGGISIYARELVGRLGSAGHRVVLFAPPPRSETDFHFPPNVRWEPVRVPRLPLTSAVAFAARIPSAVRRFEKKYGRFDVLHSSTYSTALLPRFMTKGVRVTTIYHLGTSAANSMSLGFVHRVRHPSAEYGPAVILEGLALRRANHLIAISEFTRSDILKKYSNIEASRISVIYLGATSRRAIAPSGETERLYDLWGIRRDEKVLICVGRLEERKGIRFLLAAFGILSHDVHVKLVFVGAGDPRAYHEYARSLNIEDRVVFAGRVDEPTLNAAYGLATALVHPSVMEGFGLAIADAVASGIPVVATRVGAVPEIVRDGIDGRLVRYGDASALADAIAEILDFHNESRSERGNASTRFSWERTARETMSLYERLVAGTSSGVET